MTREQVLQLLRREIKKAGTAGAWARQSGVSRAYVGEVLAGNRARGEIGDKLLAALGLERVVRYRRRK